MEEEFWAGGDEVVFAGVPESLWRDEVPAEEFEGWIDELADQLEVQRALPTGVLQQAAEYSGDAKGKLTTKFVRDWKLKPYGKDDADARWPVAHTWDER